MLCLALGLAQRGMVDQVLFPSGPLLKVDVRNRNRNRNQKRLDSTAAVKLAARGTALSLR